MYLYIHSLFVLHLLSNIAVIKKNIFNCLFINTHVLPGGASQTCLSHPIATTRAIQPTPEKPGDKENVRTRVHDGRRVEEVP